MGDRITNGLGSPADDFERMLVAHQDLAHNGVELKTLAESLNTLEVTGIQAMTTGRIERVARELRIAFAQTASLEVVPPFNEAHQQYYAGKVLTYTALQDHSEAFGAATGPTDTMAIPTGASKA
jgi:hypothetical protein